MIDLKIPPPIFDERAYLLANPDVAEAVRKGALSSGWQHVLLSGYQEPRVGLPSSLKAEVSNYWRTVQAEMPPPELRERVHGSPDHLGFHLIGRQIADDIDAALTRHAVGAPEKPSTLDFGCGCGRVTWHVKRQHPAWTITGCDIDAEAIAWCQQHLQRVATFDLIEHWPPVALASDTFDLIYAISVFTHLGEEMQFAWLKELQRLAKPGGLLLLSVHSIALLGDARASEARKEGFVYSAARAAEGLPDFYRTSWHSSGYIRDNWSQYFDIVEIVEKGINNHQDLVVACRRR